MAHLTDTSCTPCGLAVQAKSLSLTPETMRDRETHVRESWIKAMEARLVRTELEKCYVMEGVNQMKNCKWLAEKYVGMIRENKVG